MVCSVKGICIKQSFASLGLLCCCYPDVPLNSPIGVSCFSVAVDACAKLGYSERALSLVYDMEETFGLKPNIYTYTSAIEACAKCAQWDNALSLLYAMDKNGIKPLERTYSLAISACGNAGQWEKALTLLYAMKAKGKISDKKIRQS